jgi:hypothetical protein
MPVDSMTIPEDSGSFITQGEKEYLVLRKRKGD